MDTSKSKMGELSANATKAKFYIKAIASSDHADAYATFSLSGQSEELAKVFERLDKEPGALKALREIYHEIAERESGATMNDPAVIAEFDQPFVEEINVTELLAGFEDEFFKPFEETSDIATEEVVDVASLFEGFEDDLLRPYDDLVDVDALLQGLTNEFSNSM